MWPWPEFGFGPIRATWCLPRVHLGHATGVERYACMTVEAGGIRGCQLVVNKF